MKKKHPFYTLSPQMKEHLQWLLDRSRGVEFGHPLVQNRTMLALRRRGYAVLFGKKTQSWRATPKAKADLKRWVEIHNIRIKTHILVPREDAKALFDHYGHECVTTIVTDSVLQAAQRCREDLDAAEASRRPVDVVAPFSDDDIDLIVLTLTSSVAPDMDPDAAEEALRDLRKVVPS